jgi:predicted ArsR family transcriptional regulator
VLDHLEVAQEATVRDVAEALGLHENTARAHLEGLVESGLAQRTQRPASGRGRPSMVYRADVWAQADPRVRDYGHLATALATVLVTTSPDPGADARMAGSTWGATMVQGRAPHTPRQARREVVAVLLDLGFDPKAQPGYVSVALRRCPLLDIARVHPEVVCQVHLGLVQGAMTQMGHSAKDADLLPFSEPGACRLILARRRGEAGK